MATASAAASLIGVPITTYQPVTLTDWRQRGSANMSVKFFRPTHFGESKRL